MSASSFSNSAFDSAAAFAVCVLAIGPSPKEKLPPHQGRELLSRGTTLVFPHPSSFVFVRPLTSLGASLRSGLDSGPLCAVPRPSTAFRALRGGTPLRTKGPPLTG